MFEPGEKVKLLNESGTGIVKAVDEPAGKAVVEVDGFDFEYDLTELVAFDGEVTRYLKKERFFTNEGDEDAVSYGQNRDDRTHQYLHAGELFNKVNTKGQPEIDLHIHEITSNHKQMTNGEIVTYQMGYLQEAVQAACVKSVRELIIIHGVGEGVLKSEVRNYLKSLSFARYEDAPLRIYGYGATYVRLFGLTSI